MALSRIAWVMEAWRLGRVLQGSGSGYFRLEIWLREYGEGGLKTSLVMPFWLELIVLQSQRHCKRANERNESWRGRPRTQRELPLLERFTRKKTLRAEYCSSEETKTTPCEGFCVMSTISGQAKNSRSHTTTRGCRDSDGKAGDKTTERLLMGLSNR